MKTVQDIIINDLHILSSISELNNFIQFHTLKINNKLIESSSEVFFDSDFYIEFGNF